MRILQITSSFLPVVGGMEKVVFEISKRFVQKGHEVTVLTTSLYSTERLKSEENIEGIKVIRFPNDLFLGGYGLSLSAYSWLKKNWNNYDVVHSHGYNRFLSEFAISYLSGKIPVVFSPHGFIHTKKRIFFKKIHDWTFGKKIRMANLCTMLTPLDLEDYMKLGVFRDKIVEIPNGVNLDFFKKKESKKINYFKKKYKLTNKTLLFVGRIHESKGLQYIIKAIKNIDCNLILIGPDSGYKNKLQKIILEEGVSSKVLFFGSVDDETLKTAYFSSDIFVCFSEWEGFGISVIEAMAAEKPVIVSNKGSLPYLVKNEENGLVISFPDVQKLEESIKILLKNPKKRKSLGLNGKKYAEKFDWNIIVRKHLEIYNRISKRK